MTKTAFLSASKITDATHPAIVALASHLSTSEPEQTAKNCFDWVRDHIEHCLDFNREEVPTVASDVLRVGTGFCYAKSHLLVALLRANQIAAGYCYQRLTLDGAHPPFCLHGLVAVWLDGRGWYRCDPRGNSKAGIDCQFTPMHENLAFAVGHAGECIYPDIWAEPWPSLLDGLHNLGTASQFRHTPIDLAPPLTSNDGETSVVERDVFPN